MESPVKSAVNGHGPRVQSLHRSVCGGHLGDRSQTKNAIRAGEGAITSLLVVGTSAQAGISSLASSDFCATACLDARHALQELNSRTHQIVLCDLDLPGADGTKFLDRVCAEFPEIAVVVVTSPRDLRRGMLAMLSGASGYVQTPLHRTAVSTALQSALTKKRIESAVLGTSSR